MEERRSQELPIVRIPKPNRMVGPDGHCNVGIRSKRDRGHSTGMLQWRTHQLTRAGIPNSRSLIQGAGTGDDSSAIATEGCRPDRAVMLQRLANESTGLGIPQAGGPVPTGG